MAIGEYKPKLYCSMKWDGHEVCMWVRNPRFTLFTCISENILPAKQLFLIWRISTCHMVKSICNWLVAGVHLVCACACACVCVCMLSHLQCFVEPPIATVQMAASPVEHLLRRATVVRLTQCMVGHGVQTQCENAPLDGFHRFLVCRIWMWKEKRISYRLLMILHSKTNLIND